MVRRTPWRRPGPGDRRASQYRYQLVQGGGVIRLDDALRIPEDEDNPAWRAYRQWLREGHEPLPPDAPPDNT